MLINLGFAKEMTYKPRQCVDLDSFDDDRWGECTHTLSVWPVEEAIKNANERRKNEEEGGDNA